MRMRARIGVGTQGHEILVILVLRFSDIVTVGNVGAGSVGKLRVWTEDVIE